MKIEKRGVGRPLLGPAKKHVKKVHNMYGMSAIFVLQSLKMDDKKALNSIRVRCLLVGRQLRKVLPHN